MTNNQKKSVYTDNEITVSEFARRYGVKRQTAHVYKKDQRLVMTADGKRCKYIESLELLKKTAHLNGWANEQHAAKEREEINNRIADEVAAKTIEQLTVEVKESQLDLETKNAKELFENARALREKETALLAQIEREKVEGGLVSKDLVSKIMFERARACRDALMTSARRTAPLIAGKDNIQEIESLLTQEYRDLLEQFARMPLLNE